MKAKLVVIGGTASETEVNLRLPTIIGRGRSAEVTIPHSLVSRQHCELSERDGRLVVRDLESMNGTYVGDERISKAILQPGALLTVGTVTFRAVYEIGADSSLDPNELDTVVSSASDTACHPSEMGNPYSSDADTVPVEPALLNPQPLSPPLSESDADEPANAAPNSEHPSLESLAQNSD